MMGLFTKKAKPPKKKIYLWTRDDVGKWLAYLNMSQYAEQLGSDIDGQGLLRLTAIDIYTMTSSRQDADTLIQAIDALRDDKTVSQGLVSSPEMALSGPISPLGVTSYKVAETEGQALASVVGGNEVIRELYQYLEDIGIRGAGLLEATSQSNIMGLIISALWELHDVAVVAKANSANCKELLRYSQDIFRVLDARGKGLLSHSSDCFTDLLRALEDAINLVDTCGREGWLARMVLNERAVEDFQQVHTTILEILRANKLDTLPNGRQLTHGEYHDVARPLKRMLKQLGNGSWEEGLRSVAASDSHAAEVMRLVSVDREEIKHDARNYLEGLDHANNTEDGYMTSPGLSSRKKECVVIFDQYKKETGALDLGAWSRLLSDIGLLENVKPGEIDAYISQEFAAADTKNDGGIDIDEFVSYYEGLKVSKAVHQLREALGPEAEKELRKVFHSFASFSVRQPQSEMDGVRFSKFARDCKLTGTRLTQTDIDITFAKVKTKGSRRITFDQFLDALILIAERKGKPIGELVHTVLATGGPAVSATKPEYVRLNDDKSTYTGVYARGGPTNVEPSKDLSAILDRSPADLRGVKKPLSQNDLSLSSLRVSLGSLPTLSTPGSTPTSASTKGRSPKISAMRASWASPGMSENRSAMQMLKESIEPVEEANLQAIYDAFAAFGLGNVNRPDKLEMDGAKFAKLCRETGLLCSRLNATAVDLIFSKAKPKGARKIEFCHFKRALELIAEDKKVPVEQVHHQVIRSGGPRRNATQADFVRLHDDKSTFTGVYANGGPSVADKRLTIEALIDRTNASRKSMNFS